MVQALLLRPVRQQARTLLPRGSSPARLAVGTPLTRNMSPIHQLVKLRIEKGLRQADVAQLMKVRQSTVAQFESGNHDLRLSTLSRYAEAVGATITWDVTVPTEENE